MSDQRDFRFLADRVEIGFHRRPNRFRRRTWLASAVLCAGCVAWVALAVVRGEHAHFAAGPVSTAHRMIENDCARCHDRWGPLYRLVSPGAEVSSISNDKCIQCHDGAAHQTGLAQHSCAECHKEHQGNTQLADMADALCVQCHANLERHAAEVTVRHRDKPFNARITSFEPGSGGHPEFELTLLLKEPRPPQNRPLDANTLVAWFLREDDVRAPGCPEKAVERWQDRAQIRFNHEKHMALHMQYDVAGRLEEVPRDRQHGLVEISQQCGFCHQVDSSGRYMQSIRYDRLCVNCHPLRFDDRNFPGETIPHRDPKIVRGFLIERYARQAAERLPAASKEQEFPDLPFAPRLPMDVMKQVREQAQNAEAALSVPLVPERIEHSVLQAAGGCRYCHSVTTSAAGDEWTVEPPNIPDRWWRHSAFRHDSHRMADCRTCHKGAAESCSTGDVLIPGIDLCRQCHSKRPGDESMRESSDARMQGARSSCVECHTYHQSSAAHQKRSGGATPMESKSRWHGTLDSNLRPSSGK